MIDLPFDLPLHTPMALDTETSGLFVDSDYDKAPRARVSTVSLAWYDTCEYCHGTGRIMDAPNYYSSPPECNNCAGEGDRLETRAYPFDQGRVAGKPGRFSKVTDDYEELPNPAPAPWNLGLEEWVEFIRWTKGRKFIFQNAKFDRHIVRAGLREDLCCGVIGHVPNCGGGGVTLGMLWDTMLMQGVVAPLESSSLKPTAQRLWGYDEGDEQREVKAALKKNGVGLTWRYDLLPWSVIGPYAAKDTELTIRVWRHQQEAIEVGAVDIALIDVIEREHALSEVLFQMEQRAIGFDAKGCLTEAAKIRRSMAEISARVPFDPSKPNQAKKFYFGTDSSEGQLGLMPQKVTEKTKQPQLDQSVLRELAEQKQPHAEDLLEYSHLNSAISKWYVGWPKRVGHDGRLRTNFRQGRIESDRPGGRDGGAISGRLSVERIQLQAIPHASKIPAGVRGVREFFVAKPGYVLWELDLGQAEVRIATWASQCEPMAEVLRAAGSDVHGATATTVFGVTEGDPQWFELRQVAKRLTFGMLYGAGVRTIREQIRFFTGIDYSEAKTRDMINLYKTKFPEFVRASRQAQQKADKGQGGQGFVKLAGGRRRYFGWGERTHKAFNAVVQGGQAEILKIWMIAVEKQYPGVLLLMIHDSLVVEVEEGRQDEIVQGIKKLGIDIFESYFSTEELPIAFTIDCKKFGESE